MFFKFLHSDSFEKHWFQDAEGYKLCTSRYPIVESLGRVGLQEAEVFIPLHDLRTPESEDMSRSAEERIYDLLINQRYAECHGIYTMSNGSISPDLGDMWHHGYRVSPQWEGGLELDSASDCDSAYGTMERGMRDYISVKSECSLWILIRDSLCPPDVTRLRTAERRWNNVQLYGEFAALWFFTPPLPEWPSLRLDYRENFGFAPGRQSLGSGQESVPLAVKGNERDAQSK